MDVILCKTVAKTERAKHSLATKSTLNQCHYCCWGKSHETTAPLTSGKILMDQGLKSCPYKGGLHINSLVYNQDQRVPESNQKQTPVLATFTKCCLRSCIQLGALSYI